MSSKEESAIRKRIVNFIEEGGGVAIVTSGSIKTADGTPDIIGSVWVSNIAKWVHVAIEVKTETGKPSALQVETLYRMGMRGYLPMIASSVRQVDETIREYGSLLKFFLYHEHPTLTKLAERRGDEYGIWRR